ncbi:MAG TPA: hypothetical protein VGO56_21885 [Pyrinomonadaceae bacterium]|jgi:hypothetical protein|nr:hypothetical protein [Pyrinomonadaceae bacterium]
MKLLVAITFSLFLFTALTHGQDSGLKGGTIIAPDKYDEWGDAPFADEKVHLDKIAKQAKEWTLSIVYLVIHAGQTACVGEAKARGARAKEYLMNRGISTERVVPVDAGWRKELTVEAWILPPQLKRSNVPSDLDLKRSQVKLQKNCKIQYRGH